MCWFVSVLQLQHGIPGQGLWQTSLCCICLEAAFNQVVRVKARTWGCLLGFASWFEGPLGLTCRCLLASAGAIESLGVCFFACSCFLENPTKSQKKKTENQKIHKKMRCFPSLSFALCKALEESYTHMVPILTFSGLPCCCHGLLKPRMVIFVRAASRLQRLTFSLRNPCVLPRRRSGVSRSNTIHHVVVAAAVELTRSSTPSLAFGHDGRSSSFLPRHTDILTACCCLRPHRRHSQPHKASSCCFLWSFSPWTTISPRRLKSTSPSSSRLCQQPRRPNFVRIIVFLPYPATSFLPATPAGNTAFTATPSPSLACLQRLH